MTPLDVPRWPVQPLLDAGMSRSELRRLCKSRAAHDRAWTEGLTDLQADRWAVRVGRHPGTVWDGWFDVLTVLDEAHVSGGWRQAWLWSEERREVADDRRAA